MNEPGRVRGGMERKNRNAKLAAADISALILAAWKA